MGQSAWEQAAEANCGAGLCKNLACMENKSLRQRDLSVDQSAVQGAEDTERGRGFGSGGDELHGSLLSPRITEKLAVPWGRGRGAPLLLLLPWREGLCSPSIALLVGFWRFCAREELGGVSLPGEKVGSLSRAQPPPSPGS